MTDTLRCAYQELTRRKLRTGITILGYSLAVGVTLILGTGLLQARRDSAAILRHTGTHFVAFMPADRTMCPPCAARWAETASTEGFVCLGVPAGLIPAEFLSMVRQVEGVAQAAPYLQVRLRDLNDQHLFTIGGFDPNDDLVVGTTCCAQGDVVAGSFLTPQDRGQVMLEQAYARLRKLRAGDRIRFYDRAFTIKGVVNPGIRPAKADIYMPYEDACWMIGQALPEFDIPQPFNTLLVEVANSQDQEQVMRDVKKLWPDIMISSYACYLPAAQVLTINQEVVLALMIVVSLAVVLLAAKTQVTSLVERRHDLGVLKAIGWSNRVIAGQLLTESLLQAGVGAGLGLVFAMGVSITRTAAPPPLPLTVTVLGLALLGGLVATLVPVWMTARQRPTVLLRSL